MKLLSFVVLVTTISAVCGECSLSACEVLEMIVRRNDTSLGADAGAVGGGGGGSGGGGGGCDQAVEIRWRQLERRLRAIEQPLWTISSGRARWRQCTAAGAESAAPPPVGAEGTVAVPTGGGGGGAGGGGPCRCESGSRRAVSCWRGGLLALEPHLTVPADVHYIDLGTNRLRTLHKNTFKGMTSLIELDIFDNHLDFLPAGIFDSLANLKTLRLQRNFLEEIERGTFQFTRKLFHLDMSHNLLYTLPEKLFINNAYVETVDFSNNRLVYLPADTFIGLKSLQILDLSRNKLQRVENETFSCLKTLQILKLSDNRISRIPEEIFRHQVALETLLLSRNRLAELPLHLLHPLQCLNYLDLSSNNLKHLVGVEFQRLSHLRHLDMKSNEISQLPDFLFTNCTRLEKLDLAKNKLRFLNVTSFEGLAQLTSLVLSQNLLREVHFRTFANLKNLTTLNRDMRRRATRCLTKLMDIRWNVRVTNTMPTGQVPIHASLEWPETVLTRAFQSLPVLWRKYLQNGLYEWLSQRGQSSCSDHPTAPPKRYLDNNMFPSLPSRTLDFTPKLTVVKLAGNPWHCDCHALYISAWVRLNEMKLWDYSPACVSPWYVEGHFLKKLKFPELCTGQWASMVNLSPRLPIQQLLALNISVNRKPQSSMEQNHGYTTLNPWN